MNPPVSSSNIPVLTSWKDIARYMGKGVRTVQRWEQELGLPVRRPSGCDKKAILARPQDLDAWRSLRSAGSGEAGSFADVRSRILSLRSRLAVEMATARMLRASNKNICTEMHSALGRLEQELQKIQGKAA